jgi:CBS domain-containing protein
MNNAAAAFGPETTLREIINSDFVVLKPQDTMRLVDDLVSRCNLCDFPVLDQARLCSVIFHADLLCAQMTYISGLTGIVRDDALRNILVKDVMKPATTALPDASIYDAARRIVENSIECLIVTEGRKVLGLVTRIELLRLLSRPSMNIGEQGGHYARS